MTEQCGFQRQVIRIEVTILNIHKVQIMLVKERNFDLDAENVVSLDIKLLIVQ